MISEINADIEFFLKGHFYTKNDFTNLCEACEAPSAGLIDIKTAKKRIKSFISELKTKDDYITRLYNAVRTLRPGMKREIDILFNLFTGFDSVLYEVLTDNVLPDELRTLCYHLEIPHDKEREYDNIEDSSISVIYQCKEKGLQGKLILYIKEKYPDEPRIAELERASIQQTENQCLVSISFLDTNNDYYKKCREVVEKFFTTITSELYSTVSPFAVSKKMAYCDLLRNSIDRYKTIIFIIGENLKTQVDEEEIYKFEDEYRCAFFKKIPIYFFYSIAFRSEVEKNASSFDKYPYLQKIVEICKWQESTRDKSPIPFTNFSNLSSQLSKHVEQLVPKPIIVKNYNPPQVTPATMWLWEDREKNLKKLIAQKNSLVPFIGAGFSKPACHTWSDFLDLFYDGIKGDFLMSEDEEHYLELKNNTHEKKFEKIADFLVEKSGRGKFEDEMNAHFNKSLPATMKPKFQLLHRAFPGLKITTNFDCLVEDNADDSNVWVCYGTQDSDLNRLFTNIKQNSLLKIHGGLRGIHSIVLSSNQYEKIYGDPTGFDPGAPLPAFLKRVFTNCSLLFIGCSLVEDRTTMIMKSLKHMRPHFAIMKKPQQKHDRVEMYRRLSELYITPIWINDFGEIEEILQKLVESAGG